MKSYQPIHSRAILFSALFALFICTLPPHLLAVEKVITGRGEAAVVNITPEEGKLIALQRARADAIEKAVGTEIHGATVVTNGKLVGQFLQTFSRGFIIEEKKLETSCCYDTTPKYTVELKATVMIPEKKADTGFVLSAGLKDDKVTYLSGQNAVLKIKTSKAAHVGIFNLRADDRIVMFYPNKYSDHSFPLKPNADWSFPDEKAGLALTLSPLPDHKRDTEAFFVVALPADTSGPNCFATLFEDGKEYKIPEFFERYGKVAETAREQILPYEVLTDKP